ncbi:MAG: ATP-dependent helicase, partial [Armatimonadetes bacterium]|nr:ATP-dependent helicase [Armatimonadota bacterium]
RGIDVAGISHVINYDMPDCADAYIHRIGRTGRAELTGEALTLVTADDRDAVRDIEKALGKPVTVRSIEGYDYGRPTFQAPAKGRNGRPASTPTSWSGGARQGGRLTPRRASRRR